VSAGFALAVSLVEYAMRSDTELESWVFALGMFLTIVGANRHVGGGEDV
jgi:hypothetical protein